MGLPGLFHQELFEEINQQCRQSGSDIPVVYLKKVASILMVVPSVTFVDSLRILLAAAAVVIWPLTIFEMTSKFFSADMVASLYSTAAPIHKVKELESSHLAKSCQLHNINFLARHQFYTNVQAPGAGSYMRMFGAPSHL